MVGTIASVVNRRHALALSARHLAGTVLAAAATGVIAGMIGSYASAATLLGPHWTALSVAVAAAVALAVDLRVLRTPYLYCRRQVQSIWWREGHEERAAFLWGIQLGIGPLTYLPSCSYYVLVWIAALLGPVLGGFVLGLYGLARGIHPALVTLLRPRHRVGEPLALDGTQALRVSMAIAIAAAGVAAVPYL